MRRWRLWAPTSRTSRWGFDALGHGSGKREANGFAAELLMPRAAAEGEARRLRERGHTPDSRFLADLAVGFALSDQAVEY